MIHVRHKLGPLKCQLRPYLTPPVDDAGCLLKNVKTRAQAADDTTCSGLFFPLRFPPSHTRHNGAVFLVTQRLNFKCKICQVPLSLTHLLSFSFVINSNSQPDSVTRSLVD